MFGLQLDGDNLFNVSLDAVGLKLCIRQPYGVRVPGKHPC
jgi:hypothetical protein